MPQLSDKYIKSQKPWIKIAMKGRPLWFGIQCQGQDGLFRVSKKKGEVTKQKLCEGKPFDEEGKDAAEAKEANSKGLDGKAAMGVCQRGDKGILKLMVVKGQMTEQQRKFARIFITRKLKLKSIKDVAFAEVEEGQLPKVDEDAKTPEEATSGSIAKRVEDLKKRLTALGGNPALVGEIDAAGRLGQTNPEDADEALDEVEEKISELEAKGKGGTPPANGKLVAALKTWNSASAAVDKQLNDIKAAMLKEKDDAIRDIASYGLTDVDGGLRNKLNAALKEVAIAGDEGARKKASTAAQAAMKDLLKHVGGDDRIKVLSDPPNGWPKCTIKDTITPALKELATALQ